MRFLRLPVDIPLRLGGAAARTAFRAGQGVAGRVLGRDEGPQTRPSAPGAGPRGASGDISPEAAATATARTEPPPRRRRAPAPAAARGAPATPNARAATPARTRRTTAPSRTKTRATTPRARQVADEPKQPLPEPPAQAADAPVPHDPPDGTRVDTVPTGATPASPTAPASEADLVASFGPERDAGAQVRVDEPWPGYGQMNAPDIVDRLRVADDTTKAAVVLFESQGRKRKSVLQAAGASD